MEVCILGGTGFIGKHLCCALHSAKIEGLVVSRAPDSEFLQKYAPSIAACSLGEASLWEKLKSTKMLIILASGSRPASSWRAPEGEVEYNLLPISAFLRRFVDTNPNCHIVFASSGGQIYGNNHFEPISEVSAPAPVTSYGFGKLLIEQLLSFFANLDEISYTVLRIANPVGYWQYGNRHGFVTAAIHAGLSSNPLILYGDGRNFRDYFDVDDLCDLIQTIIYRGGGPNATFNVGSGKYYTEVDIIDFVEREVCSSINVEMRPAREFDLRYSALDVRKIRDVVGWSARSTIEETIKKIVNELRRSQKLII